jgi:ComF family protein
MPVGQFAATPKGCAECRGRPLGFDGAIALGPYQDVLRSLCLRLKDERQAWLVPWMIDLLVDKRGEGLRALSADVVVPVPLHWTRRLRRGYDQARALAATLATRLELPLCRPLVRIRRTPPLAGLGRVARAELLHGVFRARPKPAITGKTILLVDDILTTGATSGAAARALKSAGAAKVYAVVLGRAEGRA